jgi:hypothetical protein
LRPKSVTDVDKAPCESTAVHKATAPSSPKHDIVEWLVKKILFYTSTLRNLYSSPDIISQIKSRIMRWAGHVARMGEGTAVYRVLVGKPKGKRPLGRPRRRWEDGIKVDLTEIGWGVWSGFTWLRVGTIGGLL